MRCLDPSLSYALLRESVVRMDWTESGSLSLLRIVNVTPCHRQHLPTKEPNPIPGAT
jgi:hypothetical protein